MLIRSTSIIFICLFSCFSLFAQSDCVQKLSELDAPNSVDTLIVVDPETYEQTKQLIKVYIPLEKEETVTVIDQKTQDKSKKNLEHKLNVKEARVEMKENKTVYYVRMDDCWKIQRTKEQYN